MSKHLSSLFPNKGSVLVFSLIILSFLLVSALSIATVTLTEKRSSLATEKSSRSFQMADTGVETILQRIYKVGDFGTLCQGSGKLEGSNSSGSYRVTLYDAADVAVNCNDTNWRARVAKIKSEGLADNTTRAVEVAVAAAGTLSYVGECIASSGSCDCGSTEKYMLVSGVQIGDVINFASTNLCRVSNQGTSSVVGQAMGSSLICTFMCLE